MSLSLKNLFLELSAHWELTKPRLTRLVVLTAAFGAAVAPGNLGWAGWLWLMFGSWAIVASANVFNCYLERDVDGLMERTKKRPLVDGRLRPEEAWISGFALLVSGLGALHWGVNTLTASLGLLGFLLYVAAYTPLKRQSMSALFVGAIPGAIPPVMGWTAVTSHIEVGAWILFGILFFWQLPHFIAISLHWGRDYEDAGLKTLPQAVGLGSARRHMLVYAGLLVAVSLLPGIVELAGPTYLWTALVCGLAFSSLTLASLFELRRLNWNRIVFVGSIVYLPIVLGVWVVDLWLGTRSIP